MRHSLNLGVSWASFPFGMSVMTEKQRDGVISEDRRDNP